MRSPQISAVALAFVVISSQAQEYVAERFHYPVGLLGAPWQIANATDGANATVGSPTELGGYRPDGGEVAFVRPSSSGGAASTVSATLDTGENSGTTIWNVTQGDRVRLKCHFSFGSMGNTLGFFLRLQQGNNRITTFRVTGLSAETAVLQYATNGAGNFTNLPGTGATLARDHWYLLECTAEVGALAAGGAVVLDVALYDMSNGGARVYASTGIAATHMETLQQGQKVAFKTGISSGAIDYRIAKVGLAAPDDPGIPAPFVNEKFTYPPGPLGAPWTATNTTGGATLTIGDSVARGGYRPAGAQLTFFRPSTSAGVLSASLPTGANPGSGPWALWEGDTVKLICHFAYDSIPNGNAFVLRLWQGNNKIVTFRVLGGAGDTATLGYDTTGANTFQALPGTSPQLQPNAWYRLEARVKVEGLGAGQPVALDVTLFDMSQGATVVYSGSGISATHATDLVSLGSNTSFQTGIISGLPNYHISNINLLPVLSDNPAASSGSELLVTEFGAIPGDGLDDAPAIRAAIAAAASFSYPVVRFPAGRYDLFEVSDPAVAIIEADEIDYLSFAGDEAELVGRGLKPMFRIKRCGNLSFQGLRIDWDPLPFTAGVVVASGSDSCDIQVAPDHPLLEEPVESISTLDPGSKAFLKTSSPKYFVLSQRSANPGPSAAEVIGNPANRILRIYRVADPDAHAAGSQQGPMPSVDSHIVAYYHVRGAFAFQAIGCGNVTFRDVQVYSVPGAAYMVNNSSTGSVVRFEDSGVIRKPGTGRWKTTSVDAFFPNMNRGRVEVVDCVFEDMGDDGVNVHGTYCAVYIRVASNDIVLRGWKSPFSGGSPLPNDFNPPNSQFLVGDVLEFSEPERRHAPGFSAIVEEVLPDVVVTTPDNRTVRLKRVRLDRDLPPTVQPDTIVANASEVASFLMKNTIVRRNRGQGLRMQTRNALVENCTFEDIQGNAIWVLCDVDVGHESIATRNVTIRDTVFKNCVRAVTSTAGRVAPFDPEVHENLTIEGCTIEKCGATPFKIHSVKGALIRENHFYINGNSPVEVNYSSDVTIEDNVISSPP